MTVLQSVSLPVGQCSVHAYKSECLAWMMQALFEDVLVYRLLYARSHKKKHSFESSTESR